MGCHGGTRPSQTVVCRPAGRAARRAAAGKPARLPRPQFVRERKRADAGMNAISNKSGLDATAPRPREPGEGFKPPWPSLIQMDEDVRNSLSPIGGEGQGEGAHATMR